MVFIEAHNLTFPLQSVSRLQDYVLLVDKEFYFYTVPESNIRGPRMRLDASIVPVHQNNWNFAFHFNQNLKSMKLIRVLGTIVLSVKNHISRGIENAIIYRTNSYGVPNIKLSIFSPTVPTKSGAEIALLSPKDSKVTSNDFWISSTENNVFYQLDFDTSDPAYNITFLHRYFINITEDVGFREAKVSHSSTHVFCRDKNHKLVILPEPKFFSQQCTHDHHIFNFFVDNKPNGIAGYTDSKKFRFFGAKKMIMFDHILGETGEENRMFETYLANAISIVRNVPSTENILAQKSTSVPMSSFTKWNSLSKGYRSFDKPLTPPPLTLKSNSSRHQSTNSVPVLVTTNLVDQHKTVVVQSANNLSNKSAGQPHNITAVHVPKVNRDIFLSTTPRSSDERVSPTPNVKDYSQYNQSIHIDPVPVTINFNSQYKTENASYRQSINVTQSHAIHETDQQVPNVNNHYDKKVYRRNQLNPTVTVSSMNSEQYGPLADRNTLQQQQFERNYRSVFESDKTGTVNQDKIYNCVQNCPACDGIKVAGKVLLVEDIQQAVNITSWVIVLTFIAVIIIVIWRKRVHYLRKQEIKRVMKLKNKQKKKGTCQ